MLTEKQAWLLAASWWDDADFERIDSSWASIRPEGERGTRFATGLCFTCTILEEEGYITTDTWQDMRDRINMALEPETVYLFPKTAEGAKQRAEWCRMQAEKL